MSIGIQDIGVYIPITIVDNLEQGRIYGADNDFIENKIGAKQLPRLAYGETVADSCVCAYQDLMSRITLNTQEIECIVVCTQNPDSGGIPHSSALVHGKISAPEHCASFDIGLGCSGYVYSLEVLHSFMQVHGMKKGLLFTCDPYSKVLNDNDKNTSLLFGDAATVTLLSDEPILISQTVKFATRGASGDVLRKQDGKLFMNGRSVFNFALMDVPKQVGQVISASGIDKNKIDLFLFHQGSKFMLENMIKRIGDISDRAPIKLKSTGNTISSSIPILLQEYISDRHIKTLLISGFGVGLSWATAIYARA